MAKNWQVAIRIIAPLEELISLKKKIEKLLKSAYPQVQVYDPVPSKKNDGKFRIYMYANTTPKENSS